MDKSVKSEAQIWCSQIREMYTPQNKFQEQLIPSLKKFDRLLMDDPYRFADEVYREVTKIHKSYPRCRALSVEFTGRMAATEDFHLSIGNLIHFRLLLVNGRHTIAGIEPFLSFAKTGSVL